MKQEHPGRETQESPGFSRGAKVNLDQESPGSNPGGAARCTTGCGAAWQRIRFGSEGSQVQILSSRHTGR